MLSVLLGVFLLYLLSSDWTQEKLRDGFTLGFFPVTGVSAMLACTMMLAVDSHRHEVEATLRDVDWRAWFACVVLLAGSYGYFILMQRFGFLIATPVFLLLSMHTLGLRPWKAVGIASAVITLVVFGLFSILGVSLPKGWGLQ